MVLLTALAILVLMLSWNLRYTRSHYRRPLCFGFIFFWMFHAFLRFSQALTWTNILLLSLTVSALIVTVIISEHFNRKRHHADQAASEALRQATHRLEELDHRKKHIEQATEQLQQQLERTSEVYNATLQMSSTLDFNETLYTFVSSLANLEGFTRLDLVLLEHANPDADEETLMAYRFHKGSRQLEKVSAGQHEDVLYSRLKEEKRSHTVRDCMAFGLLPGSFGINETNPALLIPLFIHDEYSGVLVYFNQQPVYHQQLELLALHFAMEVQKARLYSKIKRLSIIDSLSGVYLRSQFSPLFDEEIERHRTHREALSCCMIDIDQFKEINDQNGHLIGDTVIKKVAWVIKSRCREEDLICRYGGDEFIIVFPKSDSNKALDIAERIRKAIAELLFLVQETREVRVTASLGLATFPADGENQKSLIEYADRCLYHAKTEGRNRVVRELNSKGSSL